MRAQMSVKRFVECHKFVWQYVINELEQGTLIPVHYLKARAVKEMFESYMIDTAEYTILTLNNNCFLCAHFRRCYSCPIENCFSGNSLYGRAVNGEINAAKKIRDAVNYMLERKEDSIFIYE